MGVGKTTIGRGLAKALSLDFYDVDQLIEERAGADIAWIYDMEGEEGFRKREQKVIDEYTQKNHLVLATGGGAVLNPENRQFLAARGFVVYLEAEMEHLLQRTEFDRKRPQLQTDNKREAMKATLVERLPLYELIADLRVRTDEMPIAKTIKVISEAVF
jgi:shikimate kinase